MVWLSYKFFRSPSGYKFLHNQNILSLLCTKIVNLSNLLAIKIGCGLDAIFFKCLEKKFGA